jgi:elongation factor Ts
MADISAKDVKALRDATGAGMMDAKKALTEAGGDMDAAKDILKTKGLAKAAARAGRENAEGAIAVLSDGSTAALVQLRCETDFSAKADDFVALVDRIADAVLADGEDAAAGFADDIDQLKLSKKENIELGRVARVVAADGALLDTYLHLQDGRGVNGVIVEGTGVDADTLHQVALHVAFAKPQFLSSDEVPAEEVERERASALEVTKAEGKPEQAWDKIVDGRLRGWLKERVLLEQGLHGDKTSVAETIGSGTIARFVLAYVGD